MRSTDRIPQFGRFVAAGLLNTALTYVIYLSGLWFLSYTWAYTLSYAAGIVMSFILNGKWVFRSKLRFRAARG